MIFEIVKFGGFLEFSKLHIQIQIQIQNSIFKIKKKETNFYNFWLFRKPKFGSKN